MDTLSDLAAFYADPLGAAKTWKLSGRKIVGYLCDNVPDELISAAGFFPLRVKGAPDIDTRIVDDQVDRLYTPEVTVRPSFVAALLARLLNGDYDLLDYLIIPHNRDAIQSIFRQLNDAKRANPALRLPVLHYLDKAWSPFYAAEVYNRDRIVELRSVLENWAGAPIDESALKKAVATSNENRRLLRALAGLRAAAKLSGVEALQAIGSSMLITKESHNKLLTQLLETARESRPRAGPRLFVGGSPLDHTSVYSAIEAAGATIISEDHCWGDRVSDMPLDESLAPIHALAERFHRRPACSIHFPMAEGARACVRRATAAEVDAAIFYVMAEDWSQNWETPGQVRALEDQGVPCLHLRNQPYAGDKALTETVTAFLSQISNKPASAP
jgi:benzoyl-CoA reductase/2-hydroxyglutaryl-CoA dehydratase subunit BcrC/BadD/HgdB